MCVQVNKVTKLVITYSYIIYLLLSISISIKVMFDKFSFLSLGLPLYPWALHETEVTLSKLSH